MSPPVVRNVCICRVADVVEEQLLGEQHLWVYLNISLIIVTISMSWTWRLSKPEVERSLIVIIQIKASFVTDERKHL